MSDEKLETSPMQAAIDGAKDDGHDVWLIVIAGTAYYYRVPMPGELDAVRASLTADTSLDQDAMLAKLQEDFQAALAKLCVVWPLDADPTKGGRVPGGYATLFENIMQSGGYVPASAPVRI